MEGAVFGVERRVLSKLGVVLRQLRQTRIVGFAQLGAGHHRLYMADLAPGAIESFVRIGQRRDEVVPVGGRRIGRQLRNQGAVFSQQLIDRGWYQRGFEGIEVWQPGEVE